MHTQPVGRWALLLSQGAFFVVAAVVPWVLLDVIAGLGFGFSGTQWFQLVLGSLLMAGLPIGLSAAWMSAARTYRQQGVIFTVALLTWWVAGQLLTEMARADLLGWLESDNVDSAEQTRVFLIGAGLLGLALWIVQSLLHRRRVMFYAALAGGLALALITEGWAWNWTKADPLPYTSGTPKLVVHGPDRGSHPGTTRLWEGVVVEGLQPGEAAVVTELFHRGLRYDASFSAAAVGSPVDNQLGSRRTGVNVDMVRSISSSLPEGWLISDDGNLSPSGSRPEAFLLSSLNSSRAQDWDTWMLYLAILEPRLVAEFPLREIIGREKQFLLEPGLCVALGESKSSQAFMKLWMQTVDRRPILAKRSYGRSVTFGQGRLERKLYVLLLDDSRKTAQVEVSPAITGNPYATGSFGTSFSTDSLFESMRVDGPRVRLRLAGLTRDQWISNVRVQVWWPELKGFHSLGMSEVEQRRTAREQKP
ncbi:hypothetical protein [Roseimicrobium sp. ORNL1]|uniref:hypothetical protein n=1 Tax=Roseimicrobium sp. ORNL1 TaxID=2711231 RepID=UPI0013E159FB|nr:hypothetical protein [Roseimicrobium sp. ORNL1]QIF05583.1 hypothetical protein G5S37_30160 [Roseimicrobium sp. ORNL1]